MEEADPTTIMLSDDGDDYEPSDREDCSEGETDELASDVDGRALDMLAFVDKTGDTSRCHYANAPSWQRSWYHGGGLSRKTLFGESRDAARAVLAAGDSKLHLTTGIRSSVMRGPRCPAPKSEEELAAAKAAADEEDAQADAEQDADDEGGEEEAMEPEEALYADFFSEALKTKEELGTDGGDDGVLGLPSAEPEKEFYGGRRENERQREMQRRQEAYAGYSDDDDGGYGDPYYDSDDPYASDPYGDDYY